MKTIILSLNEPTRADVAISGALGLSRSKIQKAIKQGLIETEMSITPHTLLEDGTKVQYSEDDFVRQKDSNAKPPELTILYEDDDVLVINKQAGVLVHDNENNTDPTIADALVARTPSVADVGDDPGRPGIVHRLDKAASGVLITAKTQAAFDWLKDEFKERRTSKEYRVLVHGLLSEPVGTITLPISRAKSHGRMAAKPSSQGGKEAITHYETLEVFGHHTLLKVLIETGRTHQIRAHMFALGHPVVGDTLYRNRRMKVMDIGRLFLHAAKLSITLPSGEHMTFEAPLPKELQTVLETIPRL